uniref:Dirigent protein n=1 Tax=Steinernema glaseri TaxID=37863 RepID=A0A1I8A427_9BILA
MKSTKDETLRPSSTTNLSLTRVDRLFHLLSVHSRVFANSDMPLTGSDSDISDNPPKESLIRKAESAHGPHIKWVRRTSGVVEALGTFGRHPGSVISTKMMSLSVGHRALFIAALALVLYCTVTSAIPTSNAQPAFIQQLIKQIGNSKKSLDFGSDADYGGDALNSYGYPGRMIYFVPMSAS